MKDNSVLLEPLIGLKMTDAMTVLGKAKLKYRIEKIDGVMVQLPPDIKQNTINLEIDDGVIVNYSFY